jgi:uncharacterized protein YecE (DUF72 family)
LNNDRDDISGDTLDLLKKYNVTVCKLDGPGFPITKSNPADHSYVRFHGRNDDIWFKGSKYKETSTGKDDPRMNRYDYLYTVDELKDWLPRLKEQEKKKTKKSRIFFNNHPNAQAVKNAFMLMDMLGMPRKPVEMKVNKQFNLDSF